MPAHVAPLLLAAATVLALAGASCSSDKSNGDDPTLPTTRHQTTTTTATPQDPFAIPEVIDEAYVNRVLAALGRVAGDALRSVVANEKISAEISPMLRAIYNDPQFEQELESIAKVLGEGLKPFKNPPGDRKRIVRRMVTASPVCIFVEVVSDFSDVLKAPAPAAPNEVEILTLRPTQEGADPQDWNVTPWSIANAEIIMTGDAPARRATCDG